MESFALDMNQWVLWYDLIYLQIRAKVLSDHIPGQVGRLRIANIQGFLEHTDTSIARKFWPE